MIEFFSLIGFLVVFGAVFFVAFSDAPRVIRWPVQAFVALMMAVGCVGLTWALWSTAVFYASFLSDLWHAPAGRWFLLGCVVWAVVVLVSVVHKRGATR